MGKTAIAWMITLVQLLRGWDAIVCDKPEQFFRCVERERSQIFVADDAFGRTEYDPPAAAIGRSTLTRSCALWTVAIG